MRTYRAVVEQVEQGNEERPPMLPVPSDHRVEVRAEGRVGVVVAKPSNRHAFGPLDGVLYLVGHLQPCHGLHLRKHQQGERQHTRSRLHPRLLVHREPAGPHMNEARILLVNFHQLLICFVLHGRLGVRSHGNQVGHALKQTSFISGEQVDLFPPILAREKQLFVL